MLTSTSHEPSSFSTQNQMERRRKPFPGVRRGSRSGFETRLNGASVRLQREPNRNRGTSRGGKSVPFTFFLNFSFLSPEVSAANRAKVHLQEKRKFNEKERNRELTFGLAFFFPLLLFFFLNLVLPEVEEKDLHLLFFFPLSLSLSLPLSPSLSLSLLLSPSLSLSLPLSPSLSLYLPLSPQ